MTASSRRIRHASLASLFSLVVSASAGAGPAKTIRVTSYKDFQEGQAQSVVLTSQGDVLPGATQSRTALTVSEDSIRALAKGRDGTLYLGVGGDGPAVLISEGGKAPRRLAKLEGATWVSALAVLPSGVLLAATAGDGRIFQVGKDGQVRLFAKVDAQHIWTLRHDERSDTLYVAAGGPGRVFAVDRNGQVRKLFEDSKSKQVLGLALSEDGSLYFGTADDAVLYKLPKEGLRDGKGLVAVHDFAGSELRSIAVQKGIVYVAVNDMARGESSAQRGGTKIVPPQAGTAPGSSSKGGLPERQGKGALFRVEQDGRVEQLFSITDGFFNDLQLGEAGDPLLAASTPSGRGRVYLVQKDRTSMIAAEFKESDVLSLLVSPQKGREYFAGTGNSAALYSVGPLLDPPKDASYQSKIFDGGSLSRWGSLRYAGRGGLKIETRTSNMGKQEGTWSPWVSLERPSALSTGDFGGKIVSPQGRYLQVRVGLAAKSVLADLSVTYQQQNQRARITEVQVGEDSLGRIARGPKQGAGKPRVPVIKIRWKVENPDEDEIAYRVYLRKVGSADSPIGATTEPMVGGWLRISGPDPLVAKTELEWNSESVPDGMYEVKVVASDERGNPSAVSLSHEWVSPPFFVDNKRPELRGVAYKEKTGEVTGQALDGGTPLAEIAYSVDGGEFFPALVKDGVLDDGVEEFSFVLPRLQKGLHSVVVRVIDAADNLQTMQLMVQTP